MRHPLRRLADVATLTCPQTARERAAANELKAALAIDTDANLVRTALSMLALHVTSKADMTLWAVRSDHGGVT
jgi:hypothetical protein